LAPSKACGKINLITFGEVVIESCEGYRVSLWLSQMMTAARTRSHFPVGESRRRYIERFIKIASA
jgi:hypothetical protein